MEGDHREAAAQAQEPFRRMQRPHELAELIVHGNAQSLEDSRRRVRSAGLGPDQARREVRELARGGDGCATAGLDDLAGDGAGAALLGAHDDDERGILGTRIRSDGRFAEQLYAPGGGTRLGITADNVAGAARELLAVVGA